MQSVRRSRIASADRRFLDRRTRPLEGTWNGHTQELYQELDRTTEPTESVKKPESWITGPTAPPNTSGPPMPTGVVASCRFPMCLGSWSRLGGGFAATMATFLVAHLRSMLDRVLQLYRMDWNVEAQVLKAVSWCPCL